MLQRMLQTKKRSTKKQYVLARKSRSTKNYQVPFDLYFVIDFVVVDFVVDLVVVDLAVDP